jgi:hypothetical protein
MVFWGLCLTVCNCAVPDTYLLYSAHFVRCIRTHGDRCLSTDSEGLEAKTSQKSLCIDVISCAGMCHVGWVHTAACCSKGPTACAHSGSTACCCFDCRQGGSATVLFVHPSNMVSVCESNRWYCFGWVGQCVHCGQQERVSCTNMPRTRQALQCLYAYSVVIRCVLG